MFAAVWVRAPQSSTGDIATLGAVARGDTKTFIAPLPRRAVVAVRCVEHFEGELTHQQGWIWSVRLCAQVVTFDLFDH